MPSRTDERIAQIALDLGRRFHRKHIRNCSGDVLMASRQIRMIMRWLDEHRALDTLTETLSALCILVEGMEFTEEEQALIDSLTDADVPLFAACLGLGLLGNGWSEEERAEDEGRIGVC